MTLSDFIETHLSDLIDDWTEYARDLSPNGSALSREQLRDAATELLLAIAADMRLIQSTAQQLDKSHGKRPDRDSNFNKLGRGHADDRQAHGFEVNALVAEYRALRASVLRRWQLAGQLDPHAFEEMIRFNEAIDQMVAESIRQFSERADRVRDLFAGVMAHDLRSPVGAILNSCQLINRDQDLSPTSKKAADTLQRSVEKIKVLIDDLVAFTRTRLGDLLPLEPTAQDLGQICRNAADEIRAAHLEAEIEVIVSGKLNGCWDGPRVNQLIVNLLTNAVRYGTGQARVEACGDSEQVAIRVSNPGTTIPAKALPTLFDPLTRAPVRQGVSRGMGLGLYICRVISEGHHGKISVASDERETAFSVTLPRFSLGTDQRKG